MGPYCHSLFPTDLSLLFLGKKHQSATKSIFSLENPKKKLNHLKMKMWIKNIVLYKCSVNSWCFSQIVYCCKGWGYVALIYTSSRFSNNSYANVNCMFKSMFPDTNAASTFSMAPTKVLYDVNHRLVTNFKNQIVTLCHLMKV